MRFILALIVALLLHSSAATAAPIDDCDLAFHQAVFRRTIELCKPLAEQGNAVAQRYLGRNYEIPRAESDYAEATKWFRKAADQGDGEAQYYLASFYLTGIEVAKDYNAAMKWGLLAARQGIKSAQWLVSDMYNEGKGVKPNYEEAYFWYLLATRILPDETTGRAYSSAGIHLTPQQRVIVKNRVAKWRPLPPDHASLTVLADWKKSTALTDSKIAQQWKGYYRKANEGPMVHGYAFYQRTVGAFYEIGNGVKQSYVEAAKWLRIAADHADVAGQWALAELYEAGAGVKQDYAEAYFWYSLSMRVDHRVRYPRPYQTDLSSRLNPEQIAAIKTRVAQWTSDPTTRPSKR
jgi:uncharacterized protein